MKKQAQTYDEYRSYQRAWFKTPRGRWQQHKSKAIARGIEFLLTFEDWWDIWQASGKWEQRGTRADQYCMARFGDSGSYERSNVRICPVGENTNEMRQGLPLRTRRGREADLEANRLYRRKQRQDRVLERPAMSKKAMNRRMVIRDGRRCWAHPGDEDYPA